MLRYKSLPTYFLSKLQTYVNVLINSLINVACLEPSAVDTSITFLVIQMSLGLQTIKTI